jgi:hypothetical protein
MSAINFPDSPTINDVHTVGDISWKWTGVAWETVGIEYAVGPTGPTGATGEIGPIGPTGATGEGVPAGGTTGQVLAKIDGDDYNTQWQDNVSYSALSDLTDTTITSPIGGQTLLYDESISRWINVNFAEILSNFGLYTGDGGSYNTTEFTGTMDGGSYNTTLFASVVDGGNEGSF